MTVQGAPDDLIRRSFRLAGHRTSVSMERAFWDLLRDCAAGDGRTVSELVTAIDAGRRGPLSRAIRVYLLTRALSERPAD